MTTMTNKKSNILTDNLGWIILALIGALILILAFPSIAEGLNKGLEFMRNR